MKYHRNNDGDYLRCKATTHEKCPFKGNEVDLSTVVEEARQAHADGQEAPAVLNSAGQRRQFTFQKDGRFTLGARAYDSAGELVPSERTLKARRLKQWAEFGKWTEGERADRFDSDLLAYEVRRGGLKGSGLTGEQFASYAAAHHEGSVAAFFKAVWKSLRQVSSVSDRYRLTLDGMAHRLWKWLGSSAA